MLELRRDSEVGYRAWLYTPSTRHHAKYIKISCEKGGPLMS